MGSGKRKEDPPSERHRCARVEMFSNHSKDRGSNMQVTTYGVDLAKRASLQNSCRAAFASIRSAPG